MNETNVDVELSVLPLGGDGDWLLLNNKGEGASWLWDVVPLNMDGRDVEKELPLAENNSGDWLLSVEVDDIGRDST